MEETYVYVLYDKHTPMPACMHALMHAHKHTHIEHNLTGTDNRGWRKCVGLIIQALTHWGRVLHICVSKLIIIGSDNGLLPCWHQAIIWANAGILLISPLGTNSSEILIEMHTASFKKIHLKLASAKRRPFFPGLNELKNLAPWSATWPLNWCCPLLKVSCPSHTPSWYSYK